MSKRLIFKEFDVTNMPKEHLSNMYCIIRNSAHGCGWSNKIEDLEMALLCDKIIVRGWATRHMWEKFEKGVINNFTLDYLYKEWRPENWGH